MENKIEARIVVKINSIKQKEKTSKLETDKGIYNINNKMMGDIKIGKRYHIGFYTTEFQGHEMKWIGEVGQEVKDDETPVDKIIEHQKDMQKGTTTEEHIKDIKKDITDWNAKERRELAKTIWDTVFMTLMKRPEFISTEELLNTSKIDIINEYARAGLVFVYDSECFVNENKDIGE